MDMSFVDFCLKKVEEYKQKCTKIEEKKKNTWVFDKEWRVMWHRWGYYLAIAEREIKTKSGENNGQTTV